MTYVMYCPMCSDSYYMDLTYEEHCKFEEYERSSLRIQDILPDLNPLEREFLKTHYCPYCQSILFNTNYTSDRIKKFNCD